MNYAKKETSIAYGHFLDSLEWDYFMTVTFKFDVKKRRNEHLMNQLDRHMTNLYGAYTVFWVIEFTSNNYQTHCHLLLKGKNSNNIVFDFYNKRKLIIPKFVSIEPYQINKGGAYYVTKYLHHENVAYGIIQTKVD